MVGKQEVAPIFEFRSCWLEIEACMVTATRLDREYSPPLEGLRVDTPAKDTAACLACLVCGADPMCTAETQT